MHSDPNTGEAVAAADVACQVMGKPHGLHRIGRVQQQGVTDRLDLIGVVGRQRFTGLLAEPLDEVSRLLIAVDLR